LIEKNGVSLDGMPIVRRLIVNEDANSTLVAAPDSNTSTFHAIPAAVMATLGIFFVAPDQAINLKINMNTPLPLNANGLVLIMGAALAQGTPNTNVEYNNPSSVISANLPIIVAGS
jgi:hypothetical protein